MDKTNLNYTKINKIYRYMKHNMPIDTFMEKFGFNEKEVYGLVEICKSFGKKIELVYDGKVLVFSKNKKIMPTTSKLPIDSEKLNHIELCVVSDTHLGNKHQQLHLLNEVYEEAYKRGIKTVLHAGDLSDGNYTNRPESYYEQFIHGFDEHADYIIDWYPKVDGIETKFIAGNHDFTNNRNNGASLGKWISEKRKDMEYLGQDNYTVVLDKVKIMLDHPAGGSAKSVSYKLQQKVEGMESTHKPNALITGHYHKSYYMLYNNVHAMLAPALCDYTPFQKRMGLSNDLGAYFIDIYADKNGRIQYFEPEEIRFDRKDVWDEVGKDKRKVKKLDIKNGVY